MAAARFTPRRGGGEAAPRASAAAATATAAPRGRPARSHRFAITINQSPDAFFDFVTAKWEHDASWRELVRFIAGQREIASTTRREHMQVYLELFDAYDYNTVKTKIFGAMSPNNIRPQAIFPGMHIEACKGSQSENLAYVRKQDSRDPAHSPWQFGTPARQPDTDPDNVKMTDRIACQIIESAGQEGDVMWDLLKSQPGFVMMNATRLLALKTMVDAKAVENLIEPRTCIALIGPTGSGKSWWAWQHTQQCCIITPASTAMGGGGNPWFCNYRGEREVVFQEMPGCMTSGFFLTITDPYPMTVQKKGGSVQFRGTKLYFTSNIHPRDWWSTEPADVRAAILARFPAGGVKLFDARADGTTLRTEHVRPIDVDDMPVIRKPHLVQPTLATMMASILQRTLSAVPAQRHVDAVGTAPPLAEEHNEDDGSEVDSTPGSAPPPHQPPRPRAPAGSWAEMNASSDSE